MDRSGLVALVLAAAVSYGAAIGIAGLGLDEDAPLVPPVPRWSRPPPPDVYPLDDTTKPGEPVKMHEAMGALHYIRG